MSKHTAIVAIILLFVTLATSQSCNDVPSDLCTPYVSGLIFSPAGGDIDTMTNTTNIISRLFLLAPRDCAQKATEVLCQSTFLPCPTYNNITEVPCKTKCEEMASECSAFFVRYQQLVSVDCEILPSLQLTASPFVMNITETTESSSCSFRTNVTSSSPATCPYPMDVNSWTSNEEGRPACVLRCPTPWVLPEEWDHDLKLAYVASYLSLVSMVFLILSFFLLKKKYPQTLFYNLFACSLIATLGLLMTEFFGGRRFLCHNGEPVTMKVSTKCGVQGALLIFGTIAGTSWWFIIIYNLYLMTSGKMNLKDSDRVRFYKRAYYVFGYVPAAMLAIVGLATSNFAYVHPNNVCNFKGVAFKYPFFFAPLFLLFAVGTPLDVYILVKLVRSLLHVRKFINKTSYKPFFTAIIVLAYTALWVVVLITNIDRLHYTQATLDVWVDCHVTNYMANASLIDCGKTPPHAGGYRANTQTLIISQALHGVLLFLFYCHDVEMYRSWKNLFVRLVLRKGSSSTASGSSEIGLRTSQQIVDGGGE